MTNGRPETVGELYPRLWLKAEDLGGRTVTVTITAAELREFRQPDGTPKLAVVLSFERATRKLICNKTQCRALVNITKSERFADWVGHSVWLSADVAPNKKQTITIMAEK